MNTSFGTLNLNNEQLHDSREEDVRIVMKFAMRGGGNHDADFL